MHFLICIHDATPAYASETRTIIRDLTPFVGRRISFAVVPNWYGEWPLVAHPDYCRLLLDHSDELLLHGYSHRRRRGWGMTTWLAEGADEMNGLDVDETGASLARGQRDFADAFGQPARTFLAPAWQRGHVRADRTAHVEHVLGFFSLESRTGQRIPLTTWTWDCGRWAWLGHVGHALGTVLQSLDRGVPVLAIHPRDLARGYWPTILALTQTLIDAGHQPTTPTQLIGARAC